MILFRLCICGRIFFYIISFFCLELLICKDGSDISVFRFLYSHVTCLCLPVLIYSETDLAGGCIFIAMILAIGKTLGLNSFRSERRFCVFCT